MKDFAGIADLLGVPATLDGARIFLTGGTGFIGSHLLRSFVKLQNTIGWNADIVVLSRNPNALPEYEAKRDINIIQGDMLGFKFPEGDFSHVIHCAAPTDINFFQSYPEETVSQIVDSTKRILEFSHKKNTTRFLYLSSGAVYGPIFDTGPIKLAEYQAKISEEKEYPSPYARGKVIAERLCLEHPSAIRARCFALSGEGLPLDKHYALGNFVGDAKRGGPIVANDGTPYRSYLDSEDLALWLWTMLAKGVAGEAYNVGSERAISIRDLAELVGRIGRCKVEVPEAPAGQVLVNSYIPNTEKARRELGLTEWTSLEESIERMLCSTP
jgi:nucleoside-diphosphate-sugar epimerase